MGLPRKQKGPYISGRTRKLPNIHKNVPLFSLARKFSKTQRKCKTGTITHFKTTVLFAVLAVAVAAVAVAAVSVAFDHDGEERQEAPLSIRTV
jgi:hypothetical protein